MKRRPRQLDLPDEIRAQFPPELGTLKHIKVLTNIEYRALTHPPIFYRLGRSFMNLSDKDKVSSVAEICLFGLVVVLKNILLSSRYFIPALLQHVENSRDFAFADGALPRKYKLLIGIAFDVSYGAVNGVKSLASQAMEASADRKDLYTGKIATPWRLSRQPHYYTNSELIKFRKWTPVAINKFLQYSDETETNPHSDSLNAPPMQLFLANGVWAVEATDDYKPYQKERNIKRSGGS